MKTSTSITSITLLAAAAALFAGCGAMNAAPASAAKNAQTEMAAPADLTANATTYGTAMPAEPAPQALSAVMKAPGAAINQPIKLTGRVGKVCQVKGCWMMLTDGDAIVRVAFGHDAFFIPKDAQGDAVVFGTLAVEEHSLATAKHLAEDAGEDPALVTAPAKEYSVNASSVLLLPAAKS